MIQYYNKNDWIRNTDKIKANNIKLTTESFQIYQIYTET